MTLVLPENVCAVFDTTINASLQANLAMPSGQGIKLASSGLLLINVTTTLSLLGNATNMQTNSTKTTMYSESIVAKGKWRVTSSQEDVSVRGGAKGKVGKVFIE